MTGNKKPLSLHPLRFKEAVADLLKIRPEPKGKGLKGRRKMRKP
jgi:hypothetical protein